MGETETTKKLLSFRLTPQLQAALNAASRLTGKNKTELVEASLESYLPKLMKGVSLDDFAQRQAKAAREQAAEDVGFIQELLSGKPSRPTPDQTAKKMAKRASAEIKKKRKK